MTPTRIEALQDLRKPTYIFLLFLNKKALPLLFRYKLAELIWRGIIDYSISADRLQLSFFLVDKSLEQNTTVTALDLRIINKLKSKPQPIEFHQLLRMLKKMRLKKVRNLLQAQFDLEAYRKHNIVGKPYLKDHYLFQKLSFQKQVAALCKDTRRRKRNKNYDKIYLDAKNILTNPIAITSIARTLIGETVSNTSTLELHVRFIREELGYSEKDAVETVYLFDYILKSKSPIEKTTLGISNLGPTDVSF